MFGTNSFGKFILGVLVLFGGTLAAYYGYATTATWMIFSGVVAQVWTVAADLWDRRIGEIDSRAHLVAKRMAFGIAASQWDQETRYFLAREWPEMGVEFGDDQIEYILDDGVNTGILTEFLRAFLQDSSENSFAELRHYNDDKRIQERFNVSRDAVRLQWRKSTEFLEQKGYLREGSMAGNRTFLWTSPEHYHVMRRRYLNKAPLAVLK